MKRQPGGDNLRTGRESRKGETDGRNAQSVVTGKNTRMTRPPRTQAQAYLLPSEVPDNAETVHVDKFGRVHMVTYRREV